MGSSRCSQYGLKNAAIVMLILSLSILLSISGEGDSLGLKQMKKVIGSRPPHCVNRCLGCRPCMAALAIQHPHLKSDLKKPIDMQDESYYLLSWKCRCTLFITNSTVCGNKSASLCYSDGYNHQGKGSSYYKFKTSYYMPQT